MNEREHKGPTRPVTAQQNERLHYIWLHLVVTNWIDLRETILFATQRAFVRATLIKWKNVFWNYFTLKQKVNVICLTILWKFKRSKKKTNNTLITLCWKEKKGGVHARQGRWASDLAKAEFFGGKCKLNLHQFLPCLHFCRSENIKSGTWRMATRPTRIMTPVSTNSSKDQSEIHILRDFLKMFRMIDVASYVMPNTGV